MTQENVFKLVAGFLIILLVAGIAAGAQSANVLYQQLAAVGTAILVLGSVALGAERGSELSKIILRWAFANIPFLKGWQPSGAGSVVLALIVSVAGVFKFDIHVFDQFPAFATLDPMLLQVLTVAVIWIGASIWHNALPDTVGKAQAVKA